jgi:hypothetical protein
LNCLASIADTHLEKVRLEEKYEKGEGRLLPNFKSFRELYMNKIQSQENMAKEMRKQQKEMKESSPMDSKVRVGGTSEDVGVRPPRTSGAGVEGGTHERSLVVCVVWQLGL